MSVSSLPVFLSQAFQPHVGNHKHPSLIHGQSTLPFQQNARSTEELVHVFPSLRDSSKSDGDAGPEAPEGRWFPAANGSAAWDER